jgi:hypothetical protein
MKQIGLEIRNDFIETRAKSTIIGNEVVASFRKIPRIFATSARSKMS